MYNDSNGKIKSRIMRCESSRLYITLILILAVHGCELLYRRQLDYYVECTIGILMCSEMKELVNTPKATLLTKDE